MFSEESESEIDGGLFEELLLLPVMEFRVVSLEELKV